MVILTAIPQGFLDDLPEEDQQAIREIVGKPVLLNEYDDAGRAELGVQRPRRANFTSYLSPRI